MKVIGLFGFLTLIALNVDNVSAWDQDEIEIYDLVEEIGINQNFYNILKVDQVCRTEINFRMMMKHFSNSKEVFILITYVFVGFF